MSASLKSKAETWCIACLRTSPALAGLQVNPVDSSEMAKSERIVVSATVGEKLQEGIQPYVVEVEVELFETGQDAESVDAIFDAIEQAFLSPTSAAMNLALSLFSWLLFRTEEMQAAADRGRNTRHRSRRYPFQIRALTGG